MLDQYLSLLSSAYTSSNSVQLCQLFDSSPSSPQFNQLRQSLIVRSPYSLSAILGQADQSEESTVYSQIKNFNFQRFTLDSFPSITTTSLLRLHCKLFNLRKGYAHTLSNCQRFRKDLFIIRGFIQVTLKTLSLFIFPCSPR